jgi:hypothetical protein
MFYLFFRIVSALAASLSLTLSAAAQDGESASAAPYNFWLRILLVGVALGFACYYARVAFEAPITTQEYGPAPPRYMTQPRQYQVGMIIYVGLCLAAYALIVGYYKDLAPFLELAAPPQIRPVIDAGIKQNALSFPTVVVLGVAVLVALLKIEHEWNPLAALRRQVWGWVSVPELANQIRAAALNDLTVPTEARETLARDPRSHVAVGDFEKDGTSVDRRWAELCYVRLWLTRNLRQGSHNAFFNEPSFSWQAMETDFGEVRDRITRIKQEPNPQDLIERDVIKVTVGTAETLRRKYCLLAACFILYKTSTKKVAIRDAAAFGVKIAANEARSNPVRYVALFLVAIVASIYLGVWMSTIFWDLLHPAAAVPGAERAAEVTDVIATRWVYYGLATFGAPIAVALMWRYLGWSYDPEQPSSYPVSYATIFGVGLCVSVVSLMLATKIGHGLHSGDGWGPLFFRDFKWGWSPALISVYIIYHIDLQSDPLLPDIGKFSGESVSHRVFACFSFAVLITLLSVLPTSTLEARPDSPWSVDKLQAVVIGTNFAISFVMALVSQFCLVKPKPRTDSDAVISGSALRVQ